MDCLIMWLFGIVTISAGVYMTYLAIKCEHIKRNLVMMEFKDCAHVKSELKRGCLGVMEWKTKEYFTTPTHGVSLVYRSLNGEMFSTVLHYYSEE